MPRKLTHVFMRLRKRHLLWLVPLVTLAIIIVIPLPAHLLDRGSSSVRILDRNGEELYEVQKSHHGSQRWTSLHEIPHSCIAALVAIEDRNFYGHAGISLKGIARALWQNLTARRTVSGGSTLTQQLARITLDAQRRRCSRFDPRKNRIIHIKAFDLSTKCRDRFTHRCNDRLGQTCTQITQMHARRIRRHNLAPFC